jgi:hypothetical protein
VKNTKETNTNILKYIMELEQDNDVISLKQNDIDYWPLLRIYLYNENMANKDERAQKKITKFIDNARHFLKILFENFVDRKNNIINTSSSDIYYLTHSTCRNSLVNGQQMDMFFTPLRYYIDELKKDCRYYAEEFAPNSIYRVQRSEKTKYIQKIFTLFSIRSRLYKKNNLDPNAQKLISSLRAKIKMDGYSANSLETLKINELLTAFQLHHARFLRLLKEKQPKIVFVVSYYSLPGLALMVAANQLSIPTVDIQHGVQGDQHVAYGSWGIVPNTGWIMLPKFFMNWTSDDVANINTWGNEKHKGIHSGILWNQFIDEHDIDVPMLNELSSKIEISHCKENILVTLQPNNWVDFIKALRIAMDDDSLRHVFWLIRLHPSMNTMYRELSLLLESTKCDVHLVSAIPLSLVLKITSAHVTLFSSVTIEAGIEGIPSLLERNCVYFSEWQNRGLAMCLANDESWSAGIVRLLTRKKSCQISRTKYAGDAVQQLLLHAKLVPRSFSS